MVPSHYHHNTELLFCWMKIFVFWLEFRLSLFLNVLLTISWDNGLAPNRRQVSISTNDGIVIWRIYGSLWLNEFKVLNRCNERTRKDNKCLLGIFCLGSVQDGISSLDCCPYKNIARHKAHTIVSLFNPKLWLMIHNSDFMMIITRITYLFTIIKRHMGNLKHTATYIS